MNGTIEGRRMEDVMRKTARLNTAVRSALTMIIELGIVTQESIFRSCPRDQSQWFLRTWKNAGGSTMDPSRRVRHACIAPGVFGDIIVKHCLFNSTRTPLIGFELTGCSLTIHPSEISEVQEFSTAKPGRIGTSPKIPFIKLITVHEHACPFIAFSDIAVMCPGGSCPPS